MAAAAARNDSSDGFLWCLVDRDGGDDGGGGASTANVSFLACADVLMAAKYSTQYERKCRRVSMNAHAMSGDIAGSILNLRRRIKFGPQKCAAGARFSLASPRS